MDIGSSSTGINVNEYIDPEEAYLQNVFQSECDIEEEYDTNNTYNRAYLPVNESIEVIGNTNRSIIHDANVNSANLRHAALSADNTDISKNQSKITSNEVSDRVLHLVEKQGKIDASKAKSGSNGSQVNGSTIQSNHL